MAAAERAVGHLLWGALHASRGPGAAAPLSDGSFMGCRKQGPPLWSAQHTPSWLGRGAGEVDSPFHAVLKAAAELMVSVRGASGATAALPRPQGPHEPPRQGLSRSRGLCPDTGGFFLLPGAWLSGGSSSVSTALAGAQPPGSDGGDGRTDVCYQQGSLFPRGPPLQCWGLSSVRLSPPRPAWRRSSTCRSGHGHLAPRPCSLAPPTS